MRFCNLSCAYCNEYDKVSKPVPLEEMYRRIDHLGWLGTAMIGISGGEPLTHPELDDIIRRMRRTGAIAGMITNGYLLNVERIERLNRAGVPCGRVMSLEDVFADPQVLTQEMVLDAEHPGHGRVRMTGFPVKLDATPARLRRPAPKLGEHTEEVLAEVGYEPERIAALREAGVI